jgi:hypothetical protein
MSNQNQISTEIPEAVIEDVMGKLRDIRIQLSTYLQGLTAQDRRELFKMGDKTVATVSKVKSYLETNPEFMPSYMNRDEFAKDERLVQQLTPLLNMMEQLKTDTEDTVLLAGSEALTAALMYYGTVKEAAAKGVATAKPIYEDLKARFAKRSSIKPAN